MTDGPRVTIDHARALGYCAKGMRAFAERHGLDWNAFRAEGIPAATMEATGDAMAIAAARKAREEHGAQNG